MGNESQSGSGPRAARSLAAALAILASVPYVLGQPATPSPANAADLPDTYYCISASDGSPCGGCGTGDPLVLKADASWTQARFAGTYRIDGTRVVFDGPSMATGGPSKWGSATHQSDGSLSFTSAGATTVWKPCTPSPSPTPTTPSAPPPSPTPTTPSSPSPTIPPTTTRPTPPIHGPGPQPFVWLAGEYRCLRVQAGTATGPCGPHAPLTLGTDGTYILHEATLPGGRDRGGTFSFVDATIAFAGALAAQGPAAVSADREITWTFHPEAGSRTTVVYVPAPPGGPVDGIFSCTCVQNGTLQLFADFTWSYGDPDHAGFSFGTYRHVPMPAYGSVTVGVEFLGVHGMRGPSTWGDGRAELRESTLTFGEGSHASAWTMRAPIGPTPVPEPQPARDVPAWLPGRYACRVDWATVSQGCPLLGFTLFPDGTARSGEELWVYAFDGHDTITFLGESRTETYRVHADHRLVGRNPDPDDPAVDVLLVYEPVAPLHLDAPPHGSPLQGLFVCGCGLADAPPIELHTDWTYAWGDAWGRYGFDGAETVTFDGILEWVQGTVRMGTRPEITLHAYGAVKGRIYGDVPMPTYGDVKMPTYGDVKRPTYGGTSPTLRPPTPRPPPPGGSTAPVAGTYRCLSASLDGRAVDCRLYATLVLSARGTYQFSSESGRFAYNGTHVVFDGGLRARLPALVDSDHRLAWTCDWGGHEQKITYYRATDG